MVSILVAMGSPAGQRVYAAGLTSKSMTLSSSAAGATAVSYDVAMTVATGGPVGSLTFEFCSNSPLLSMPCVAPPGLDAGGAVLGNQAGETGFSKSSGSTANLIILTRPPSAAATGSDMAYTFDGLTNPADDGPLFARVATYPTSDASGPPTDEGGLALMIHPVFSVNAEVPPYLLFCIGESITDLDCSTATEPFSDIGTLGPLVTGAAQSQLVVATNAADGYTMWVQGGTMASGNNTLPAMTGEPSQKGVSQFGINLRANTSPIVGEDATGPGAAAISNDYNVPNEFRYQSGDPLVTTEVPDDFRKYTISYIVNVADTQPGGVYSTTLTYLTLANF